MYTPLFSRPVILDMMREWLNHRLGSAKFTLDAFLNSFDLIIAHQLDRILATDALPSVMARREQLPFGTLPLLGYIAIYSLNLMLLRTIISPEGYVFDEQGMRNYEDGAGASIISRIFGDLGLPLKAWRALPQSSR